jgi:hypothetical protein
MMSFFGMNFFVLILVGQQAERKSQARDQRQTPCRHQVS